VAILFFFASFPAAAFAMSAPIACILRAIRPMERVRATLLKD
jgi:hypothetical protein